MASTPDLNPIIIKNLIINSTKSQKSSECFPLLQPHCHYTDEKLVSEPKTQLFISKSAAMTFVWVFPTLCHGAKGVNKCF